MLTITFDSTTQANHVAELIKTHGVPQPKIAGHVLRIDEDAIKILGELNPSIDGHYDGHAIWIGCTEYRVTRMGRPTIAEGTKSTRIMLTVDPATLLSLTATAKRCGITRSEAIRRGIAAWLNTTPWSRLVTNEAAHAIEDLRGMEYPENHAVVLTLDSDGTPGAWLADLDDEEATALPYTVIADLDDDLGDDQLPAKIDYDYAIAQVQKQWLEYPSVKTLTTELVSNGNDPGDVAEATARYSEYPSCEIGGERFLAPTTVLHIRDSLNI